MDTESELSQKRLEVRQEILALKEQIPSARIFNVLGRAFRHNSPGYWLSNITLLALIQIAPGVLLGLALKESNNLLRVGTQGLLAIGLVLLGITAGHFSIRAVLDDLAKQIVEHSNHVDDLSKLLRWLQQTWSTRFISAFVLPYGLLWMLLGIAGMSVFLGQFVGFGFTLWSTITGLLAGVMLYIPFWTCLLAFNLRNYRYEMNAFSPADSEVIDDISNMMTRSIYVLSATTAVISLVSASSLVSPQSKSIFAIPLMTLGWATIIA